MNLNLKFNITQLPNIQDVNEYILQTHRSGRRAIADEILPINPWAEMSPNRAMGTQSARKHSPLPEGGCPALYREAYCLSYARSCEQEFVHITRRNKGKVHKLCFKSDFCEFYCYP